MNALFGLLTPLGWAATFAFVGGLVMLALERPGRSGIGPVVALAALALGVAGASTGRIVEWAPLVIGLVVATLARDGEELLHGECAIKLLWVMAVALALSWSGLHLLTLATGTPVVLEQWAVLQLGLEPIFLWSTALPLSLLVGVVLLGGAPFHFWIADVFQGVRPWLAPLAVAALQVTGAGWLAARLDGIDGFRPGALLVADLLRAAATIAFAFGAATLIVQRRPERRVGTLASLQGALALAHLASGRGLPPGWVESWAAHLALALTGASTLARFMPASSREPGPGAPLARRHPLAGALGLYAVFSLAGVPGTPGAALWLDAARALGEGTRTTLLLVIGAAWVSALGAALGEVRATFGLPSTPGAQVSDSPLEARLALLIAGAGLAVLALRGLIG